MKWFKFYGGDYLSDPKMLALSASERSCWLTILSYACVEDGGGVIKHVTEERLMIQSGIDATDEIWDKTVGVLEKLKKLEMIQIDDGVITILNWQKRQEVNLTGYERTKKYRKNNSDKISARNIVHKAILKGEIIKGKCEVCGDEKTEAHHTDYLKPLEVRWLCKKHHENSHHDDTMMTPDKKRIEENRREDTTKKHVSKLTSRPKSKTKKELYADTSPMTLKEFLEYCRKSPQRQIQIIAEWAEAESPPYATKGRWRRFFDRNLVAARDLVSFSNEELQKSYDKLRKDVVHTDKETGRKVGFITKYSLETLGKYI